MGDIVGITNRQRYAPSVQAVGVDIGRSRVKVVQLRSRPEGIIIERAAALATPPGMVSHGEVTDPQALGAQIKKLWSAEKFVHIGASIAVGGRSLVLRWLELPVMESQDLERTARFEARKFLSFPVDEALIQVCPVRTIAGEDEPRMKAMLIAAPRRTVESRAEALEAAGVVPLGAEIEPFAILRALTDSGPDKLFWRDQPVAHILVGSSSTDMYVSSGGELKFARSIPFGGDSFAHLISSGSSVADMESPSESLSQAAEDGDTALPPEHASLSELDRLSREIGRLLAYYRSLFPERSYEGLLERVVLSGGAASVPGIAQYLGRKLHVQVVVGNPFERFRAEVPAATFSEVARHGPAFSVAMGLALKRLLTIRSEVKAA